MFKLETRTARPDRRERGSALVMSLMVMVIMTMMGVSFLMVSETENQIAVADRDAAQALYLATAGTRMIESLPPSGCTKTAR